MESFYLMVINGLNDGIIKHSHFAKMENAAQLVVYQQRKKSSLQVIFIVEKTNLRPMNLVIAASLNLILTMWRVM